MQSVKYYPLLVKKKLSNLVDSTEQDPYSRRAVVGNLFGLPGHIHKLKRSDKTQGECSSCGQGACTHSLLHNTCPSKTEEQNIRSNGGNKRKMPPHPIRIAKTIDVIARITFPTAYAVFLIFFFIHYTSHPSHWSQ
ncbi:glutamate-gated chloride channel alpha-like isoform X2 [Aphis craccivora]|uniref:Glutamate-gated chloride channel alpha-like isoform X2 n=1 Tax=Aphis craccivora TaxID=307492 RepID=A0A6G0YIS0_APHCR|nr:glutamate-gated chloride channel alpha-like isoform X2 [Aphis craccivora]